MRYGILALFSGLLLGAMAPMDFAAGIACNDTNNVHDNGETCCACGWEDLAIDKLSTDTGSGTLCIWATEIGNYNVYGDFHYANQCQMVGTTAVDFTVQADKETRSLRTEWKTEVKIISTECNNEHNHDDIFVGCE